MGACVAVWIDVHKITVVVLVLSSCLSSMDTSHFVNGKCALVDMEVSRRTSSTVMFTY